MSQADELLNSLTEETVDSSVTGGNFVIGADRFITVPESLKKIGVQYDHDVETVTFDCPRYWDGRDLSTMIIYVNYMRADGGLGTHRCSNVVVDDSDSSMIHFDWVVSGDVTYVSGNLSFLVCAKKVDNDGMEVNHWNSELCTDVFVSAGMKCQDTILRKYPDIITQLLTEMDKVLTWMAGLIAGGLHSHTNLDLLETIKNETVTMWNEKTRVYISDTKPETLTSRDLWLHMDETGMVGVFTKIDDQDTETVHRLFNVDTTLTKAGVPADAKAVADAMAAAAKVVRPVEYGGTGANNADDARKNLDAAKTQHSHSTYDLTDGILPQERGGTGHYELTADIVAYDNSASGLPVDTAQAAIDALLQKFYAGEGLIVNATVLTDAGEPVEGATIDGMYDSIGGACVTGADGKVQGYTASTSLTLKATGFYDLVDGTAAVSGDKGDEVSASITMTKRNFLSITSTQTKKFSAHCTRVDVSCAGGGGGGGGTPTTHSYRNYLTAEGGGGGGGYATTQENVEFESLKEYTATVGAGGTAAQAKAGGTGGTSSFLGVSAKGGSGGQYVSLDTTSFTAAAGNGNGGTGAVETTLDGDRIAPTAGTQTIYSSFTATKKVGGGGGAGDVDDDSLPTYATGASPYGGNGAQVYCWDGINRASTAGKGVGGGGGGGAFAKEKTSSDSWTEYAPPSKGYRGEIGIRMHH